MKALLLPVKDPSKGKQRLAGILSPGEREEMVWQMLEDVAAALDAVRLVDQVVVVSTSEQVCRFALRRGWRVVEDTGDRSESRSVDLASCLLKREGVDVLLRLPADIPWLQSPDVDGLFEAYHAHGCGILVPSRDGTGTNALLRTPPDAFPSRFGPDSRRLHREEARRRNVELMEIASPRIAFDLDDPGDVLEFLRRDAGRTRTGRFLLSLNTLQERSHGAS